MCMSVLEMFRENQTKQVIALGDFVMNLFGFVGGNLKNLEFSNMFIKQWLFMKKYSKISNLENLKLEKYSSAKK